MARNDQLVRPGLGKNYISPRKPGQRSKRKDALLVSRPGQNAKRRTLLQKLKDLDKKDTAEFSIDLDDVFVDHGQPSMEIDEDWVDEEPPAAIQIPACSEQKRRRRNLKADTHRQYQAWTTMMPSLVEPLLNYIDGSSGQPTATRLDIPECKECDGYKTSRVICLFWDRKYAILSI